MVSPSQAPTIRIFKAANSYQKVVSIGILQDKPPIYAKVLANAVLYRIAVFGFHRFFPGR